MKMIKQLIALCSVISMVATVVASSDVNYSSSSQSTQEKLEQLIAAAKNPKSGMLSRFNDPAMIVKLEQALETCKNKTKRNAISQENESEESMRGCRPSFCSKDKKPKKCKQCKVIPFSLGNGLPKGTKGAIPNSDGSFGPFVISKPGNYLLQNSPQMQITGATQAAPNNVIEIQSGDVHLDLCGHTLNGSGNLTQQYFIDNGVPLPNVSGGIQNDARVDASQGIIVNPLNAFFGDDKIDNVTIANGKLQYFSFSAIAHYNVTNMTITDIEIANCSTVTKPFAFANPIVTPDALFGFLSSNIIYKNLKFISNHVDIFAFFCDNIAYSNSIAQSTRGNVNTTGPADVFLGDPDVVEFGFYTNHFAGQICTSITVENVQIWDVKALLAAFGFYAIIPNGPDIQMLNLKVSDLAQVAQDTTRFTDSFNQFGYEARAYALEGEVGGALIDSCIASTIRSHIQFAHDTRTVANDTSAFNVCCDTASAILRNCSAIDITTAGNVTFTVPDPVSGQTVFPNASKAFPIGNTSALYENCAAIGVNGGLGASPMMKSSGFGFLHYVDSASTTPSTLEYRSCTAENCIGDGYSACFSMASNCTLVDCHSSADPVLLANELSNGFIFTGTENIARGCAARGHSLNGFDIAGTNALVVDSISNGNGLSGFNVSGSSISVVNNIADFNGEHGFHVNGTSDSVTGNSANQNVLSGFLDDSLGGAQANHNLYALNRAYDNKAGLTYLDNYVVDYVNPANPTVLQQGSVTSATFPVTTGEANVSITQ